MKFLLIFLGLLALTTAYELEFFSNEDLEKFLQDQNDTDAETYGWILNGQGKKAVRNFLQTIPCGWPEYGIPPLAPYANADLQINIEKSIVEALLQFIRIRVDGLDKMRIKKLKISYTFKKKVRYHFIFDEIKATSDLLNSNVFADLKEQLGISVRYEGSGPLEFALENLELQGQFKYKMPIIFGSIRIYKFQCSVSLGSVRSNIGGILGNGAINEMINDEIEAAIPAFINGKQQEISQGIEQVLVPLVNAHFKGKKIWSMLGNIFQKPSKCVPPPLPWSAEEHN